MPASLDAQEQNLEVKQVPTNPKRTKKKSTLTRLKERKQKESASNNKDAQPLSDKDSAEPLSEYLTGGDPFVEEHVGEASCSSNFNETRATADEDKEHRTDFHPRVKPRGHRKLFNAVGQDGSLEDASIKSQQGDSERIKQDEDITSQVFRNISLTDPLVSLTDSLRSQTNFVPKPPSTPRSSRSTPRTPRGFVTAGKGENQLREPWSSGESEDPENEHRKDKNEVKSTVEEQDANIMSRLKSSREISSLNDTADIKEMYLYSGGQSKENTRRNSKDSLSDSGIQRDSGPEKMSKFGRQPESSISVHTERNHMPVIKTRKISLSSTRNESLPQEPAQNKNNLATYSPEYVTADGSHSKESASSSSFIIENYKASDNNNISDTNDSLVTSPMLKGSYSEIGTFSNHDRMSHLNTHSSFINNHSSNSQETAETHSKQFIETSDQLRKKFSTSPSNRIARLDPISPRSYPPTLPDTLSSTSLGIIYKTDPELHTIPAKVMVDSKSNHFSGDDLSQKSVTSASVLPVITVKNARSRNCVEGSSLSGVPSPLGTCELERYFPARKVNVFVGTWNMNELKDVLSSLDDFVLPDKCEFVQDIYAIGTQENNITRKEWEIKIQETLGSSHVLFHAVSLGALHLAIFIRRDLTWFCSAPEEDAISLRAVTMVKTKGAIGVCFSLFGTSFLFINCHLTSDRYNNKSRKKNRLEDYYKVISRMRLPKLTNSVSALQKPTDITSVFDSIFWFGDLNFRIDRKRHAVEGKVIEITSEEFPSFETLLGGDQLLNCMAEGKIFEGFQEGRINFHPTFKFDLHADTYDSSAKNRVPSYTDRIIFHSKKKHDITCIQYDAVMSLKSSDHRPVYGLYEVTLSPPKDNVVYTVGHFDRSIYMEAVRRRTVMQPIKKKQSAVCTIQ